MDSLQLDTYQSFLLSNFGNNSFHIIAYVHDLFSAFPDFDVIYDEEEKYYYMTLDNIQILFPYKTSDGELLLYFFGDDIRDKDINDYVKKDIYNIYVEIKKMYLGLQDPEVDGYKFKQINLFKSTKEFLDKPKLNNLFYFYNYIPKKYSDKATVEDNVISGKMLMFKEHDTHAYDYLLTDIKQKLMLLDNKKEYIVCSIPGHRMTEENTFNSFDEAVKMFHLPKNFNYFKNLIIRTHTVYKKAFGAHVMWNEEVESLMINSSLDDIYCGETVIVLDDITTTGASMQAAKFLLLLSGVKDIIFIAYGKTTHL